VFPYKYNEDARNLGEYLFRSLAYPAVVFGGFESAFSRLTGVRASLCSIKNLRADLIVNMETDFPPYHDISMAAVADYDFANVLKLGGGIEFYHLISVDERMTTPSDPSNDSAVNSYIDANGNTGYYSSRGIKMMGRLRFDPKRIFAPDGDFGIWGKEDWKIYGEIALLGLKSYPDRNDTTPTGDPRTGYNDIMQKMPIMFGFNLPTTKWGFDVLTTEFEWFGIKYPNDAFIPSVMFWPRPVPLWGQEHLYASDNWKWTVYAKRHIGEHFFVTLMVARDHSQLKTINCQYFDETMCDVLVRPQDWWWSSRMGFEF
jgi:hypothetical protein